MWAQAQAGYAVGAQRRQRPGVGGGNISATVFHVPVNSSLPAGVLAPLSNPHCLCGFVWFLAINVVFHSWLSGGVLGSRDRPPPPRTGNLGCRPRDQKGLLGGPGTRLPSSLPTDSGFLRLGLSSDKGRALNLRGTKCVTHAVALLLLASNVYL